MGLDIEEPNLDKERVMTDVVNYFLTGFDAKLFGIFSEPTDAFREDLRRKYHNEYRESLESHLGVSQQRDIQAKMNDYDRYFEKRMPTKDFIAAVRSTMFTYALEHGVVPSRSSLNGQYESFIQSCMNALEEILTGENTQKLDYSI